VRRIALSLPETSEQLSRGLRQWRVKDKGFVWQRPLRRGDLEALGDMARTGRSWAHAWNIRAKEALLVDDRNIYFSTPHSDGHPAIFVRLYRIGFEDLHELIVEAWLAQAPARLTKTYVDVDRSTPLPYREHPIAASTRRARPCELLRPA
jgi:hypothetical protein